MVLAGHVTPALLPAWFTSNKLLWVAWKNVKMSRLSVSIHSLTDRKLTGRCCTTRHYFHTTVIVLFYINVSSLSVSLLSRRLCSSYSTSLSFFLTALSSSSWTHSLHSYLWERLVLYAHTEGERWKDVRSQRNDVTTAISIYSVNYVKHAAKN